MLLTLLQGVIRKIGTRASCMSAALAAGLVFSGSNIARADFITGLIFTGPYPAGGQSAVFDEGEQIYIQATAALTLQPLQPFLFNGHVWAGDWIATFASITLYDGVGNSKLSATFDRLGGPTTITGFWGSLVYLNPGTFFPHYEAQIAIHAVRAGDPNDPSDQQCFNLHAGTCFLDTRFAVSGSTAITVLPAVSGVPGPVAGTGLPGLILTIAALFGWWRRERPGWRFICRRLSMPVV